MKIKTKDLKAMVAKVQKGYVPNGILPITGLINLKYDGVGTLSIRTTDGSYHYRAVQRGLGAGSAFVASVNASLFVSLVAKTTSEEVELSVVDASLSFRGNGNYRFEVVYESGVPLDFPPLDEYENPLDEHSRELAQIPLKELADAFASCEVSMAKSMEKYPQYSGMNVGSEFVSTNNATACVHKGGVSVGEPYLIPYPALRFLPSFSDEKVSFTAIDDGSDPRFRMYDGSFDVCGPFAVRYRDFPAAKLKALVESPLSKVAINVAEALGAVERIDLFSRQYQSPVMVLSFGEGSIDFVCVRDGKKVADVSESVDVYEVGPDGVPTDSGAMIAEGFECVVAIQYLQDQLKALRSDKAVIGFGNPRFITVGGGSDLFMLSFAKEASK